MWIMTNVGFISAVQDRENARLLIVRARAKQHLEALFEEQKPEIFETPDADYRFRCRIEKHELKVIMCEQIEKITYDNFKNSVKDAKYHDALIDVWYAMNDYQKELLRASKKNARRAKAL